MAKLPAYMQPQQPAQPPPQLQPGQPGYQFQSKKKKPNMTGLYVVLGAVGLLIIGVIVWYANQEEPKPAAPPSQTTVTSNVALTEAKKKELYVHLLNRKEMLRPMNAVDNAYKTLAQEYHVSVEGVHAIEAEGNAKHWPRN